MRRCCSSLLWQVRPNPDGQSLAKAASLVEHTIRTAHMEEQKAQRAAAIAIAGEDYRKECAALETGGGGGGGGEGGGLAATQPQLSVPISAKAPARGGAEAASSPSSFWMHPSLRCSDPVCLVFANLDDHCSAENLRDFIENADDCGGVIRVQDVNVATKKTKKAAVGSGGSGAATSPRFKYPGRALAVDFISERCAAGALKLLQGAILDTTSRSKGPSRAAAGPDDTSARRLQIFAFDDMLTAGTNTKSPSPAPSSSSSSSSSSLPVPSPPPLPSSPNSSVAPASPPKLVHAEDMQSTAVWVGNIESNMTDEALAEIFLPFLQGTPASRLGATAPTLLVAKSANIEKGPFAFVDLGSKAAVARAVNSLRLKPVPGAGGRSIRVDPSRKPVRQSGGASCFSSRNAGGKQAAISLSSSTAMDAAAPSSPTQAASGSHGFLLSARESSAASTTSDVVMASAKREKAMASTKKEKEKAKEEERPKDKSKEKEKAKQKAKKESSQTQPMDTHVLAVLLGAGVEHARSIAQALYKEEIDLNALSIAEPEDLKEFGIKSFAVTSRIRLRPPSSCLPSHHQERRLRPRRPRPLIRTQ